MSANGVSSGVSGSTTASEPRVRATAPRPRPDGSRRTRVAAPPCSGSAPRRAAPPARPRRARRPTCAIRASRASRPGRPRAWPARARLVPAGRAGMPAATSRSSRYLTGRAIARTARQSRAGARGPAIGSRAPDEGRTRVSPSDVHGAGPTVARGGRIAGRALVSGRATPSWSRSAWAYFAWRFEGLERIPRGGPAIVACNHASYLDPIANAYARAQGGPAPRFLAKDDLFEIPLVGGVPCGGRGRSRFAAARATGPRSELAAEALRAGEVVVIYPEGTVTTRTTGFPWKGRPGVVRLSLATGVADHADGQLGFRGRVAEVGPRVAQPRRPVWVQVGAPVDLTVRRDRGGRRRRRAGDDGRVMATITASWWTCALGYPRRWLGDG